MRGLWHIMMENITFSWLYASMVQDELLDELSKLYSQHYGTWGPYQPKLAGKQIKLSSKRLREWLSDPDAAVYYATLENRIIGYAIAIRKKVKHYGVISWVTQLVVHKNFRNQDIAKRLLFSIWGLSDDFAWGILSANPYAVRALEKSTRRRSIPIRIHRNIRKIIEVGSNSLPYISKDTEYKVDADNSRMNTKFFIDHSEVPDMLKKVISEETPWNLGDLPEGWEWIAFTFRDQEQINLSRLELEEMVATSDDIAKQAYARMQLDNQPWMRHTDEEVCFILQECALKQGMRLIDFGCGIGRHGIAISKYGIQVIGVDYVESNILEAKRKAATNTSIEFLEGDCRSIELGACDAAICLYDVIGSFVKLDDNQKILNNIAKHLKPGGIAIISVMNFELTAAKAKYKFSFSKDPNRLLKLSPSTIMEHTGDVFQEDFMMVDEKTHIIYRREQFIEGRDLPKELLVRDRRFTMDEIISMCEKAGLQVLLSRYVSATNWNRPLSSTDDHAKEILLKCRKI